MGYPQTIADGRLPLKTKLYHQPTKEKGNERNNSQNKFRFVLLCVIYYLIKIYYSIKF